MGALELRSCVVGTISPPPGSRTRRRSSTPARSSPSRNWWTGSSSHAGAAAPEAERAVVPQWIGTTIRRRPARSPARLGRDRGAPRRASDPIPRSAAGRRRSVPRGHLREQVGVAGEVHGSLAGPQDVADGVDGDAAVGPTADGCARRGPSRWSGADGAVRPADRLGDLAEALAAQHGGGADRHDERDVRPKIRSDGMWRWSMWTWEISTTSGARSRHLDVVVAPEVGHAMGQRRVGEHLDAAELDHHAGVAEPRDRRAGGRRGSRRAGVTTAGSVGLRDRHAAGPHSPAGRVTAYRRRRSPATGRPNRWSIARARPCIWPPSSSPSLPASACSGDDDDSPTATEPPTTTAAATDAPADRRRRRDRTAAGAVAASRPNLRPARTRGRAAQRADDRPGPRPGPRHRGHQRRRWGVRCARSVGARRRGCRPPRSTPLSTNSSSRAPTAARPGRLGERSEPRPFSPSATCSPARRRRRRPR